MGAGVSRSGEPPCMNAYSSPHRWLRTVGTGRDSSAIDLAILTNAELIAGSLVRLYPTGYFESSLLLNQQEVTRLQEQADAEAQGVVDTVKERAQAKGVRSTHD